MIQRWFRPSWRGISGCEKGVAMRGLRVSRDGRVRLADRPGSLTAEGVSGFPEGLPRSRGGPERRPRSGAVANGLESRWWRCLVTKGHPEKREFASAAAARKLTRATSTGAASASRRWPGASAPARRHFRAPYPGATPGLEMAPVWKVPVFAWCVRVFMCGGRSQQAMSGPDKVRWLRLANSTGA